MRIYLISIVLLCSITTILFAEKYIPIVLVHGVMSDAYAMKPAEEHIRKYMGDDVYIKSIDLGCGTFCSFQNLHTQVEYFKKEVENDPHLKDGFNIIAHSQGGLVSRYFIQRYNHPHVFTYISWGSPQQGVYGTPGTLDKRFMWLNYLETFSHRILYSGMVQQYVSFAGYWHDTLHYDSYLSKCTFLPYINNEVVHEHGALFKKNLCSLTNMVVVMSTNETIVEPRISCHFGFYKPGSKTVIQKMKHTALYKDDSIGLKTLDESGRLHLRTAHCTHENFQEDEQNFVDNTLEFLKLDPFNQGKAIDSVLTT